MKRKPNRKPGFVNLEFPIFNVVDEYLDFKKYWDSIKGKYIGSKTTNNPQAEIKQQLQHFFDMNINHGTIHKDLAKSICDFMLENLDIRP